MLLHKPICIVYISLQPGGEINNLPWKKCTMVRVIKIWAIIFFKQGGTACILILCNLGQVTWPL